MKETSKHILYAVAMVLIVLGAIWLGITVASNGAVTRIVGEFGYVGLLFAAIVSGFNVVVPVPLVAFVPTFVASGLLFWPIIFIITVGMTIGDTIGFFVGRAGRALTKDDIGESRFARWIVFFADRHPKGAYFILFLYATFAPAPNEVVVIPMAFLGYKFRYMIPVVFVGNFIFNTLTALGVLQIATFF